MKRCLLLMTALALLLGLGVAAQAEDGRELTLMIYMCGSNLESDYGSASADILEMLQSGCDFSRVNVLLMTGGAQSWNLAINPDRVNICELADRGMRIVGQSEPFSMGMPETLLVMIDYCVMNYPADDYALILWDHGGGPMEGVCWDELFSMDHLSLSELTLALENCSLPKKLRFIGFDACLMGSVEVARAMSPYAEYMIASQETEPARGWNYGFLGDIVDDEDGAATGRRIVDGYFEGAEDVPDVLTLSCVDLSRIEAVVEAMDEFFAPMAASMDADQFARLSGVRMASTGFGAAVRGVGEEGYDLVDLNDLVVRCGGEGRALTRAVADAVVYSRSDAPGASGLSVYHPLSNKRRYLEAWREEYETLGFSAGYTAYLERFGAMLTGKTLADWSDLEAAVEGATQEESRRFSIRLTEEQRGSFADAQLLVLGKLYPERATPFYVVMYAVDAELGEDGTLSATYGDRALYVTDEAGNVLLGPVDYRPGARDGFDTALAYYYDSLTVGVTRKLDIVAVTFDDPDPDTGVVAMGPPMVYDRMTETFTNRIAISEDDYPFLGFRRDLRLLPETDGVLPGFAQWDEANFADVPSFSLPRQWRLRFIDGRLSGVQLYASFQVTDLQQNVYCTPLVPIETIGAQSVALTPDVPQSDRVRVEASAAVDASPDSPGFDFTSVFTNLSDEPLRLESGELVLNDRELTQLAYAVEYAVVQPGASLEVTIKLKDDLARLDALTSLGYALRVYHSGEDTPIETIPVRFTVSDFGKDALAVFREAYFAEESHGAPRTLELSGGGAALALSLDARLYTDGLLLTFDIDNTGGRTCEVRISSPALDRLQTDAVMPIIDALPPGLRARRGGLVNLTPTLSRLGTIGAVRFTVTATDAETGEVLIREPVTFRFDDLAVNSGAADDGVLAEAEADGVLYQLLDVREDPIGALVGSVRVSNASDAPVTVSAKVWANGVQVTNLGMFFRDFTVDPGMEYLYSFTTTYNLELEAYGVDTGADKAHTFTEKISSRYPLECRGFAQIDRMTFAHTTGSGATRSVNLTLPTPAPLREDVPGLSFPARETLVEGDLGIDVLGAIVGNNGIGLLLEFRNDTDEDATFAVDAPFVDGVGCAVHNELQAETFVPARTVVPKAVCFELPAAPEVGKPAGVTAFGVRVGGRYATARFTLEAAFGRPGGMVLEVSDIAPEPATLSDPG